MNPKKQCIKRRGFNIVQSVHSSNYYLISENQRDSTLVSPIFRDTIEACEKHRNSHGSDSPLEKKERNEDYYLGLYDFFKRHGFFKDNIIEELGCFQGKGKNEAIERYIANCGNVTFEVTDACNLRCTYCGYGDLYLESACRGDRNLPFALAKNFLDFFFKLKNSNLNKKHFKKVNICFYGGESLLNFTVIEQIVEYVKQKIQYGKGSIGFRITTNGVLLDKYMKYLVENRFDIRISLDGDKENNQYRMFFDGSPSFDIIYKNIQLLRKTWPDYFAGHVNFNSVIHRKNSVKEVENFFQTQFGKFPRISELSMIGVRPDKFSDFKQLHRRAFENLQLHSKKEGIHNKQQKRPEKRPLNINLLNFLNSHTKHIVSSLQQLDDSLERMQKINTGTCKPFSRKIFCTVEGKLLPCERIPQATYLARVNEEGVSINYNEIGKKYRIWNEKLSKQCNSCYSGTNCLICLFHLYPDSQEMKCDGHTNIESYKKKLTHAVETLERFPEMYKQLLDGEIR